MIELIERRTECSVMRYRYDTNLTHSSGELGNWWNEKQCHVASRARAQVSYSSEVPILQN